MKNLILGFTAFLFSATAFAGTCDSFLVGEHLAKLESLKSDPATKANPLLQIADEQDAPFDYSTFNAAYFRHAIPAALKMAEVRFDALRTDKSKPTYQNTIEALIAVTDELDPVMTIFSAYTSMATNDELDAIETEFSPQITKFGNAITFDAAIFARVKAVYEQKAALSLTTEQKTVLENTYKSFTKNGALLNDEQKKQIDDISSRLTLLTQTFKKNLSKAVEDYSLKVTDENRLKGLKPPTIAAAKQLAIEKGEPNAWYLTIQAANVTGVLEYADDRTLREEIWRAFSARASSAPYDNRPVAIEIAQLRQQKAQILGYETHAHLTTESRMAQNPDTVFAFINRLKSYYRPAAERDLNELREFAASRGLEDLKPWDTAYYSQLLQTEKYSYDSDALKAYFPYEAVMNGALRTAERLFKIKFIERKDLKVWEPSVRAYEVVDSKGHHLAYYYNDPYARKGKRAGAWMTTLQDAGFMSGRLKRPHVVNVLNLAPPVDGKPSLLSIDEVRTIFHELGHGLHGMLTKVKNRTISGTSVAWDFVELPSQLNELWAIDPDNMQTFAHHFETGEVIPRELIEKVRKSDHFQIGMFGLGQLRLAMLDMTWYTTEVSQMKTPEDVDALEAKIADFVIMPTLGMLRTPAFAHIFSGGYSAGYYSYKWADALVADAFEYFTEMGIFDEKTADRYRREILERGGTENPAILYPNFRGQEADPDALLRAEGLIPPK